MAQRPQSGRDRRASGVSTHGNEVFLNHKPYTAAAPSPLPHAAGKRRTGERTGARLPASTRRCVCLCARALRASSPTGRTQRGHECTHAQDRTMRPLSLRSTCLSPGPGALELPLCLPRKRRQQVRGVGPWHAWALRWSTGEFPALLWTSPGSRTAQREIQPKLNRTVSNLIVGIGPPGSDCFTLGCGGGSINSV